MVFEEGGEEYLKFIVADAAFLSCFGVDEFDKSGFGVKEKFFKYVFMFHLFLVPEKGIGSGNEFEVF